MAVRRVTRSAANAATGSLVDSLAAIVNQIQTLLNGDVALEGVTLSMGSTDENVASTAFTFTVNGVQYQRTAIAAGTAISGSNIPANLWGLYRFVIGSNGTVDPIAAAGNATGYATEALAIAALPAVTADHADMGYVTIRAAAANPFVPGTSALQGGTGGNPAQTTNYYGVSAYAIDTIEYKDGGVPS